MYSNSSFTNPSSSSYESSSYESNSSFNNNDTDDETTRTSDDESKYSTSSSFSSSSSSSSSSMKTPHIQVDNKKGLLSLKKRFIYFSMFTFNILFILLNVIIFLYLFIKSYTKRRKSNNNQQEEIYQYEMKYYTNDGLTIINEIVEYDFTFDGKFKHFDDENGNGILIKLETEGDEYKICLDECKCIVECTGKNDINECGGNGMECVDYKCVNNGKRRGETISTERKALPAIAIAIPFSMCIFGVFTSTYLANEYGVKYFSEKCDDKCDMEGINVLDDGTIIVDPYLESQKRKRMYQCSGNCIIDEKRFQDEVLHNSGKKGDEILDMENPDLDEKFFDSEMILKISKENQKLVVQKCKRNIQDEIISHDEVNAETLFNIKGQVECEMSHDWIYVFKDKGINSEIHNIGTLEKVCMLDPQTIRCV